MARIRPPKDVNTENRHCSARLEVVGRTQRPSSSAGNLRTPAVRHDHRPSNVAESAARAEGTPFERLLGEGPPFCPTASAKVVSEVGT